jgi:hypothetical protein
MLLNFVRVYVVQNWDELILNVTAFVVRVWRGQYRKEMIMNITVFFGRL